MTFLLPKAVMMAQSPFNFSTGTTLDEFESLAQESVNLIVQENPPGANGLITKLIGQKGIGQGEIGQGGVVRRVNGAAVQAEAGEVDDETVWDRLNSASEELSDYESQLRGKIDNSQIADPEENLLELSGLMFEWINIFKTLSFD
jgi:hypothetical protein